jgi:hypothetical protein
MARRRNHVAKRREINWKTWDDLEIKRGLYGKEKKWRTKDDDHRPLLLYHNRLVPSSTSQPNKQSQDFFTSFAIIIILSNSALGFKFLSSWKPTRRPFSLSLVQPYRNPVPHESPRLNPDTNSRSQGHRTKPSIQYDREKELRVRPERKDSREYTAAMGTGTRIKLQK